MEVNFHIFSSYWEKNIRQIRNKKKTSEKTRHERNFWKKRLSDNNNGRIRDHLFIKGNILAHDIIRRVIRTAVSCFCRFRPFLFRTDSNRDRTLTRQFLGLPLHKTG